MAVMRNIHNPQPPGPTIAKLISDCGIPTPKVKKIRTTGQYMAEWYQKGMLDHVPPASNFKSQIEAKFDGIQIVKLQNTHAYWRTGNPIIIATVFFDIIDFMRPKADTQNTTPFSPLNSGEMSRSDRGGLEELTTEQTAIILSFIQPPTPVGAYGNAPDLEVNGAITKLLETIQRGTLALPAPQQPIAFLPASTPTRESALVQPSDTSTLIVNSSLPVGTGYIPSAGGEVAGVGDKLPATRFIAQHGVKAFVQQLKREAAEAGDTAQTHYRAVNPPVTFDTSNPNTITIES